MLTGNIFNIQRFCIHDGPGIRSTVFFKGCPLSCKWCANPESQTSDRIVMHDSNVCVHCHCCEHACQNSAISFTPNDDFTINRDRCKGCGKCVEVCKSCGKALSISGDRGNTKLAL